MNQLSTLTAKPARDMSIDWEVLPSLQHLLDRHETPHQDAPVWAETMPVAFEDMQAGDRFHEPLEGLSIREMTEPDIFKALFGPADRSADRA